MASEHKIQSALVEWTGYARCERPELQNLFVMPNCETRNAVTRARLNAQGMRPGVPDLFLAWPAGGYPGLFIEIKTPRSRMRKSQKQWKEHLTRAGYAHAVCRSWVEAKGVLETYLDGEWVQ